MNIISKSYHYLDKLLKIIILAISILMIISTFMQVFSREILQDTWKWTDELSRICLVWLAFTSSALGIRYGSHIRIDSLYNVMPKKVRAVLDWLGYLCVIVFSAVVIKYGFQLCASTIHQLSTALRWPMGVIYAVVPVSGIFMILFTVEAMLKKLPGTR